MNGFKEFIESDIWPETEPLTREQVRRIVEQFIEDVGNGKYDSRDYLYWLEKNMGRGCEIRTDGR
jgi:hypothetical protein